MKLVFGSFSFHLRSRVIVARYESRISTLMDYLLSPHEFSKIEFRVMLLDDEYFGMIFL